MTVLYFQILKLHHCVHIPLGVIASSVFIKMYVDMFNNSFHISAKLIDKNISFRDYYICHFRFMSAPFSTKSRVLERLKPHVLALKIVQGIGKLKEKQNTSVLDFSNLMSIKVWSELTVIAMKAF